MPYKFSTKLLYTVKPTKNIEYLLLVSTGNLREFYRSQQNHAAETFKASVKDKIFQVFMAHLLKLLT